MIKFAFTTTRSIEIPYFCSDLIFDLIDQLSGSVCLHIRLTDRFICQVIANYDKFFDIFSP